MKRVRYLLDYATPITMVDIGILQRFIYYIWKL